MKRLRVFAVLASVVFVFFVAADVPAQGADSGTFTIAVIPDTQMEVHHPGDPRFDNRTQWLVDHRADLNLKFAVQVGDISNWGEKDPVQYARAAEAMGRLRAAGIPYTVAPGNHDTAAVCPGGSACDVRTTRVTVRQTPQFNTYFTAAGFGDVTEQFEPGKVDNVYASHRVDGVEWGVLSLELWPRLEVVKWARRVVGEHPDANIIVVTHSYLRADGSIAPSGEYGAKSPEYLYSRLIRRYPQIKLVLSGHAGTSAFRTDTGRRDNRIYSFLQTFHDQRTNPVRLITVNPRAGTVSSRVYAPYTGQWFPAWATPSVGVALSR